MDCVIDFINSFPKKISQRDDIAGELKNFCNENGKDLKQSYDYFNISDLVTPSDSYVKMKLEKVESQKSKEIKKRGRKIHTIAQRWLKQHPKYNGSESLLDGFKMGIFARGKIDGRIDESIVEIKSITNLPDNIDEIIKWRPQYLEQLAFYCAIDPLQPKENYLMLVTNNIPYEIKVFKVIIKDFDKIKKVLKRRIHLFKQILEGKEEPKIFKKCRFCFEEDCNIKDKDNCPFLDLASLECEVKDFIEISEDPSFCEEIANIKKNSKSTYNEYSTYNILCPRKYCLNEIIGIETPYGEEEQKKIMKKDYFTSLIYEFCKIPYLEGELKPSKLNNFKLKDYNLFEDKNSIYPEGKILPFITGVSYSFNVDRPSDYKVAELGLYLMAHELTKGLIFIYYPRKDTFKVFEINFTFKGNYLFELNKMINILDNAQNYSSLPKCPDYFCKSWDGKECQYLSYCEVENV